MNNVDWAENLFCFPILYHFLISPEIELLEKSSFALNPSLGNGHGKLKDKTYLYAILFFSDEES